MNDNTLGAISGIVLMGLYFGLLVMHIKTAAAVIRIEARLNLILKQSGIDVKAKALEQAASLMREGKKIEAIKKLRELTGCGLAEAKQRVESLA